MTITDPTPEQIREDAEAEWSAAIRQAVTEHEGDLRDAARKLREACQNADRVFRLRTGQGETAQPEPAAGPPEPGPVPLREQIIFWLSGPGIPPLGWTVMQIARQTGVLFPAVKRELLAMAGAQLVRFSQRGDRITWYLLEDPAEQDQDQVSTAARKDPS